MGQSANLKNAMYKIPKAKTMEINGQDEELIELDSVSVMTEYEEEKDSTGNLFAKRRLTMQDFGKTQIPSQLATLLD